MKLAAGIIFYNDKDSLRRCINSLGLKPDIIFCIDGKFPTYPADSQLSDDGSREVVKSYPKCQLIDCSKPEFDKRQKYLELCSFHNIDVLLIIDSDEYVIPSVKYDYGWHTFYENIQKIIIERDKGTHNVYSVQLNHLPANIFMAYPRIWYRPSEMEYYSGRHYFFRNKYPPGHPLYKINLPHQADHTINIIEGIKIGHDHTLRTKQHMDGRFQYQTWQVDYESKLPL